jgi:hypothetical protein
VATIASSIVSPRKMTTSVQRAAKALSSDVVRIRYDIATDWIGTPSIFFRIILTDKASEPENLREVAQRVSLKLMNEAKTDESGLHAYFSFRSRSEQAKLKEPAWA